MLPIFHKYIMLKFHFKNAKNSKTVKMTVQIFLVLNMCGLNWILDKVEHEVETMRLRISKTLFSIYIIYRSHNFLSPKYDIICLNYYFWCKLFTKQWNHFCRKNFTGCDQLRAPLVAQTVKNLPAIQETWVQSLGWEDTLEKSIATHSSILAWRISMDRGAR